MRRRSFLGCLGAAAASADTTAASRIAKLDGERVLRDAERFVRQKPVTVTSAQSQRSAGNLHDYFSEGDYWWPDPANPGGPYIQRDGMSNPGNFDDHRRALMRFSVQMPALAAAWHLSGQMRYAERAADHLRAWFVNERTRMNPSLQFAQAIHGRTTGRGTGVIDTIHLVEVAQAVPFVVRSVAISKGDAATVKQWFAEYLTWMTTSKNGMDERDTKNNHAVCWGMQVAAFAKLTGNAGQMDYVRNRYKTVYIPDQEASDGSFPAELARTKPYGYSLFNLEAMTAICQILSNGEESLFNWTLPDGRGIQKAVDFLFPFIADKTKWPKKADVMYFDQWPMRQSALLFAGVAFNRPEYLELWKRLPAESEVEEVIRNFFIRQPVLWIG